jgi:hypothetical protein
MIDRRLLTRLRQDRAPPPRPRNELLASLDRLSRRQASQPHPDVLGTASSAAR